ncbi:MAG: hypothetical protein MI757_16680, partial [Pirellulales bacterium]|nr:hypothetical protein [Pirellulales bacterium]
MQEQLLGYLLGALEPDEQREVEQSLSDDPLLRYQLEELRAELEPLEAGLRDYDPPLALAARTCEMVASRPMATTADEASAAKASRMRLIDMAVAASVVLAAAALFVPAVSNSRYAAHLAQCQNNLRQLGRAILQFGESNGQLPEVPTKGNLAAAGVYAPLLADQGHTAVSDWIVCPASD